MSNIALSWAFRCHVGNASAKAVLVYLADRADDDGTAAYPKIATIVNVTELSERTVRAALKTLQERGFIRRGDQRYARLGKGGRNRLPQYCQIVWDLAVESDPSTLEWIKETHAAERDPKTMGNTVDSAASTIMENGESKDVTPENAGTKPIPSTANLAGLENDPEPALQISHLQHCESCTPSTANAAGLLYKDKTLQVNPPSKPSFPSAPTGHLPASGATAAEKNKTEVAQTHPRRPGPRQTLGRTQRRHDPRSRPHRRRRTRADGSGGRAGAGCCAMAARLGRGDAGRIGRPGRDGRRGGDGMITRIDCSEAGFSEFLLANPQLDGHGDLIWQLHAVYWRNKRLGHPKAVGLLIQYARAWAARNPGETAIGRLQARKTPMTQGRRP